MGGKRVNFSRKREAILSVLRSTDTHPSAEWVYNRLKTEYPDLSRGTVYRNLNHFCETGQAVKVGVVEGHERFDGLVSPHAHMMCSRCGRILDVDFCPLTAEQLESLSQETGCKIEAANVTFTGLCPSCAQEQESPSEE